MDKAQLLDALDTDYAADSACHAAIRGGGQVRIFTSRVPVEHVVRIYSHRVRHLADLGAETIGSDDVIARLSVADGLVQIASVDTPDRHFVVFVDGRERVVSSWGVPASHRDDGQSVPMT